MQTSINFKICEMKKILKKINICVEIQNNDASDERKKRANKVQKMLSKMWVEKNLPYLKKVKENLIS